MSREIKFRFWDSFGKQMYFCSTEWKDYLSKFFIEYDDALRADIKPVLMQYTGLVDVNKKEIYEGDILTFATGDDINPFVFVEWEPEDAKFYCNGYGRYGGYLSEFINDCEVVGNIYENTNLLK